MLGRCLSVLFYSNKNNISRHFTRNVIYNSGHDFLEASQQSRRGDGCNILVIVK